MHVAIQPVYYLTLKINNGDCKAIYKIVVHYTMVKINGIVGQNIDVKSSCEDEEEAQIPGRTMKHFKS